MYGHRSFLMMGGKNAADILSLIRGGYEILDCYFAFNQGIDDKGKVTTKVNSGTLSITLSQLPSQDIIEWALNSRKYLDGLIIVLDAENLPLEKIYFQQATCTNLEIDYVQTGDSYATTKLVVQAGRLIVGDGIEFENEWINH